MKHIKAIGEEILTCKKNIGCGECQTSCQSASKTSKAVANQPCENISRTIKK